MIRNITGTGNISREHTVYISSHPGATDIDMCDYIKPHPRACLMQIIILTNHVWIRVSFTLQRVGFVYLGKYF